MKIAERVMHLISKSGLKPSEISVATGIDQATFTRFKQSDYKPSIDTIISLAQFFNVTTGWILIGKDETIKNSSSNPALTDEETELLKNCKRLNTPDQIRILERIKTVGDMKEETEARILRKTLLRQSRSKPALKLVEAMAELKEKDEIKVFNLSASAGFENYLDQDSTYEMLRFDEDEIPDGADYGIRISGNSMEPDIEDGSIVWVKEQIQIESGQIGIFILDGESFCKKLEVDYQQGEISLLSLNEKYSPIVIREDQDLKTVGRVLL